MTDEVTEASSAAGSSTSEGPLTLLSTLANIIASTNSGIKGYLYYILDDDGDTIGGDLSVCTEIKVVNVVRGVQPVAEMASAFDAVIVGFDKRIPIVTVESRRDSPDLNQIEDSKLKLHKHAFVLVKVRILLAGADALKFYFSLLAPSNFSMSKELNVLIK